jgi:transposase-like protein
MATEAARASEDLSGFACPNPECIYFNQYGAGNLRVGERNGKDGHLRRLVCRNCKTRFQERKGTLMEGAKISPQTVALIIKCLTWGNSVAATADIAEVDERTVERMVRKAGERAKVFHDRTAQDIETAQAQFDEVHAKAGEKR